MPKSMLSLLLVILVLGSTTPCRAEKPKPSEPVDGLQLSITTDQPKWALRTPKKFEAILKNVGNQAIVIDVFGNLHERFSVSPHMSIAFENWNLYFESAQTGKPILGPGVTFRGLREFARDQFVRLEPGTTHNMLLTYTLENFPTGHFSVIISYHPPTWHVTESGWVGKAFPSEHVWGGLVLSNLLTVEVVEQ